MQIATGEVEEDTGQDDGKDRAAQEMGRKGGAARAKAMTPEQRAEIARKAAAKRRSEEHTSELQSLMRISYAVFCLKKKRTASIKDKTSSEMLKSNETTSQHHRRVVTSIK